jgi:hypothetical protein
LGKGVTSEVLSWNDNQVLKLAFHWLSVSAVEREYAPGRTLYTAGLPIPAAHELIEIEGRFGIAFERMGGPSLLHHVQRRPWSLFAAARQLAELHAQVHSYVAPAELPSQRAQIEGWISKAVDFTAAEKELARRVVTERPEGNAFVMGTFIPRTFC